MIISSHRAIPNIQRLALLVVVLCGALTVSGYAQKKELTITVVGNRELAFGDVTRPATSTVDYSSASSAEFLVEGRKNKEVRLTVTTTDLTKSSVELPITITNSDCAYSTDNGVTWNTFTTGTLYQDVKFPNDKSKDKLGTILVRVGGTVNAISQNRGTYNGTVTLTATYVKGLDDDDEDDD